MRLLSGTLLFLFATTAMAIPETPDAAEASRQLCPNTIGYDPCSPTKRPPWAHTPPPSVALPVKHWFYANVSTGPFDCTAQVPEANATDTKRWTMLSSYRSGGIENVQWKYASDPDDPMCLENWSYYNENATQLIGVVSGRLTTKRSDMEVSVDDLKSKKKTWCALAVYRPGGALGKQFGECLEPVFGRYSDLNIGV